MSREIFVPRNVIFHENVFPYKALNQCSQATDDKNHDLDFLFENENHLLKNDKYAYQVLPRETVDNTETKSILDIVSDDSTYNEDNEQLSNNYQNTEDTNLRRSKRQRKTPSYLKDYIHQVNNSMIPRHFVHNKSVQKTNYPISSILSYESLSKEHLNYTLVVSTYHEPQTYSEACQDTKWVDAINKEIKALENNETWHFTNLPKGKKPIGCKWIFKIKYNSDSTIERHKARLVAKDYTQLEGIDFIDTFSPIAILTIVRLLLATTATRNWYLLKLDVENAFLHGNLDEEVYMSPPPKLRIPKLG